VIVVYERQVTDAGMVILHRPASAQQPNDRSA